MDSQQLYSQESDSICFGISHNVGGMVNLVTFLKQRFNTVHIKRQYYDKEKQMNTFNLTVVYLYTRIQLQILHRCSLHSDVALLNV